MAWRLARSLEVLRDEIRALHPGTTVWSIGDSAHAATWSDHNPNTAGVVCAIDVLGDRGLSLPRLAEVARASRNPNMRYVIYNRRIASHNGSWREYKGSNPHTTHVHVSVGNGPDGRSTTGYDSTAPWGLLPPPPPPSAPQPKEDTMQASDKLPVPKWLRDAYPTDPGFANGTITIQTALASGYGHSRLSKDRITKGVRDILAGQAAVLAAVAGRDVLAAVDAKLAEHRAELVVELAEDLAERLADRLTEVPAEQVRTAVREEGAALLARTRLTVDEA